MGKSFRLQESQMLENSHFPAIGVFNLVRDNSFVEVIEWVSKGRGFGVDYGSCTFPDDLDEYELETRGSFEGVNFGLHNGEEIILDYKTVYYYLKLICASYLHDYPQDKAVVDSSLNAFALRYEL